MVLVGVGGSLKLTERGKEPCQLRSRGTTPVLYEVPMYLC